MTIFVLWIGGKVTKRYKIMKAYYLNGYVVSFCHSRIFSKTLLYSVFTSMSIAHSKVVTNTSV